MKRKLIAVAGLILMASLAYAGMGYFNATSVENFEGDVTSTGVDISLASPSVEITVYNDTTTTSLRFNPTGTGSTIDTDNYDDYPEIKAGKDHTFKVISTACGLYSEDATGAYRVFVSERE